MKGGSGVRHKSLSTLLLTRPLAYALFLVAATAFAQDEIATFKLKDVSADFAVRYSLDDRTLGGDFTRSNVWREELTVRTQSYVYHPALLNMEIEGALAYQKDGFDTQMGSNKESELLFDYDARFRFLSRKQYPFTVYFSRQHPEMVTNLLGRYLIQTDTYGLQGIVSGREAPLSLRWDINHVSSDGSGFGSTVDENVDHAFLSAAFNYLNGQSLRLDLDWNERLSRSGSAGLPIQESLIETVGGAVSTKNAFGESKLLRLRQSLNLMRQTTTTGVTNNVDRLGYTGDVRWIKSKRHEPYLTYMFRDEDRTSGWTRSQNADLGTTYHVTDVFDIGGSGKFSRKEDPGFSLDRNGVSVNAAYRIPLSFGRLSVSGSLGANRTDQEATTDTVRVFDERHILNGVVSVPLNADFVLVDTVIVTNVAQTQTFIDGLDYRLVTIGSTTTIERIITGNILDGQEVLVNYEFQTGGTAEYRSSKQTIGLNLIFVKYVSLYAQLLNANNDVDRGNLTVPLNDMTSVEAGASLEVPLVSGWSVGGRVRYVNRDEDISPSVGAFYEVYARTGRYWGVSAQLGLAKENIDNEFSNEDVDQLRYFFSVSGRLPGSAQLSYSYNGAEDDGGSVTTKDKNQRLQFDWRYRRVLFSLRAIQSESVQGVNRRESTRVTAELRRSF